MIWNTPTTRGVLTMTVILILNPVHSTTQNMLHNHSTSTKTRIIWCSLGQLTVLGEEKIRWWKTPVLHSNCRCMVWHRGVWSLIYYCNVITKTNKFVPNDYSPVENVRDKVPGGKQDSNHERKGCDEAQPWDYLSEDYKRELYSVTNTSCNLRYNMGCSVKRGLDSS